MAGLELDLSHLQPSLGAFRAGPSQWALQPVRSHQPELLLEELRGELWLKERPWAPSGRRFPVFAWLQAAPRTPHSVHCLWTPASLLFRPSDCHPRGAPAASALPVG